MLVLSLTAFDPNLDVGRIENPAAAQVLDTPPPPSDMMPGSWLAAIQMEFDQLKRREFLSLLGGAGLVWPVAGHAHQGKRIPRVGVLLFGTPETDPNWLDSVAACGSRIC